MLVSSLFAASSSLRGVAHRRSICSRLDLALSRALLETCGKEYEVMKFKHFLKLNDSKTELMFGTVTNVAKITVRTVFVGDSEVEPSGAVRDIGVMLDSALTMGPHLNRIIKSCYYQIRSLSKIWKYLTEDSAKSLTHAFVSSRLDGMNSLLYKVPDCLTHKLQLIQHNAAYSKEKKVLSYHPPFDRSALAACEISY